ncbi:MAG: type II toxin-antitoxin system VapC family toxin [Pontimonas sp.]
MVELYGDSSALMKMVTQEKETPALTSFVTGENPWEEPVRWGTSFLGKTEVARAASRISPEAQVVAGQVIAHLWLAPIDRHIMDLAGLVAPKTLRTLDALHLATALTLGFPLVAYDQRLIQAAQEAGLTVYSPGMTTSQ